MCAFLLMGTCALLGQEFETAIIKPYKAGGADEAGHVLAGGQLSLGNRTAIELVSFAYSVRENAIEGSPDWFRSEHFDVIAQAPPGTVVTSLRLMMRALLASEFRLRVHEDTKVQDAFALVVAKGGPKLQRAARAISPGCARGAPKDGFSHHIDCYNMTMSDLAERLPNESAGDIERPIVDKTGIAGNFDMSLDWVGEAQAGAEGPGIFEAVRQQLGLRLEGRKLPLAVVVIDRAERLAN